MNDGDTVDGATVLATQFKNEEEFLQSVRGLAHDLNWKTYHTRRSTGSDKGFPDLVMFRGPEQVAAELKMPGKKPTPEQEECLAYFAQIGAVSKVWRPEDWDSGAIDEVLK